MTDENASEIEDFKYIVRVANTDIDGEKGVEVGLRKIKGVGKRVAEIVVRKAGISRLVKIGALPDEKIDELKDLIQTYGEFAPIWTLNRRNDYETGEDLHLTGMEVEMTLKDDVNRLKMIRCYRGIRHETGQKVRGQRTRSNGRSGLTLGVSKRRS